MEAQAPPHPRGSVYLIVSQRSAPKHTYGARLGFARRVLWPYEKALRAGREACPPCCVLFRQETQCFSGSVEKSGTSDFAVGRRGSILRSWLFGAPLSAMLCWIQQVNNACKPVANRSFQDLRHFLKFCVVGNPPEARSGVYPIYFPVAYCRLPGRAGGLLGRSAGTCVWRLTLRGE